MPKVFAPVSLGEYASSLVVKLFELSAFDAFFASVFWVIFGAIFASGFLFLVLSSCLVGAGYPSGGAHAYPGLTFPFPYLGFLVFIMVRRSLSRTVDIDCKGFSAETTAPVVAKWVLE